MIKLVILKHCLLKVEIFATFTKNQTLKIEAYKIQNNLALPIMETRLEKNKHSM